MSQLNRYKEIYQKMDDLVLALSDTDLPGDPNQGLYQDVRRVASDFEEAIKRLGYTDQEVEALTEEWTQGH